MSDTSKAISAEQAKQELVEQSRKVGDAEMKIVLEKENEIRGKVKNSGQLHEYIENVKSMFALIKAYYKGEYRETPWFTMAAIVTALLYVFNPLDLVPDFIPVLGLVDDALVIAACIMMVKEDLATFDAWRNAKLMAD